MSGHIDMENHTQKTSNKVLIGSYLLIGGVALLLRVLDLDGFVTHDEVEFWIDRSETFLNAILRGDYTATAISTHPGVTTMWLGTIGIFLRRALRSLSLVQEVPFPLLLALMRLPVAVVHTVGVIVGYTLLRRLFPPLIAFLAALLWATDPFVIGYSRLLHVDALAGTFATLSLLAALVAWRDDPTTMPKWWSKLEAMSGVCAGLAFLSKSPALAIVPIIGVLGIGYGQRLYHHLQHLQGSKRPIIRLAYAIWPLGLWSITAAATFILLWPAMWTNPMRVYEALQAGVAVEGAQPHMTGNFFLGEPTPAPGLLFYPVALALRTTPWSLIGILLLPWAWWWVGKANRQSHRTLAALATLILLFVIGLSLFPKKFNRYLVPAFPALDVLAAVGLVWGANAFSRLLHWFSDIRFRLFQWVMGLANFYFLAYPPQENPRLQRRLAHFIVGLVSTIAIANAVWWHPYSIAAFNQLLGGAQTGIETFSVGWGEGYGQVAAWLNQQEDITGVVTAAIMMKALNPYLRHGAQATTPHSDELPDKTGYVVVYIYQAQGTVFPPFDRFYPSQRPVHMVTIHGVPYAWIYQVPPPVATARPADFGDVLHLRGVEQEEAIERGKPLLLKLFWQTTQQPSHEIWLFVHVVGETGGRYAQIDMPHATSSWQPNRFVTTEIAIPIPEDLPAGDYHVVMGLYDPETGQRLPLTPTPPATTADPALDGEHALILLNFSTQAER